MDSEKSNLLKFLAVFIPLIAGGIYFAINSDHNQLYMPLAYLCFIAIFFFLNYFQRFIYYPKPYSLIAPLAVACIIMPIGIIVLTINESTYLGPESLGLLIVTEELLARRIEKIFKQKGINPIKEPPTSDYYFGA